MHRFLLCGCLAVVLASQVVYGVERESAESGGPDVVDAATEEVPEVVESSASSLKWSGGWDLRVRHEIMHNTPLLHGVTMPHQSYIRTRPRVWGDVSNEHFKLYIRGADEFRTYFRPSDNKSYKPPDEVILDSLYLDLYGLFDDYLDLRIGRQDFWGPGGPEYGAGRVLADGTPFDGSRSAFFDAIKARVKFDEKNTLDLLAIYNHSETELSWGRPHKSNGSVYKERPLTAIDVRSKGMDEYGGGFYFKSRELEFLPFELYYLYKRETKARLPKSVKIAGRKLNTFGTRMLPQLTDTISAEFEGAVQVGEIDGGGTASGYLGYTGLTYKPAWEIDMRPYFTGSFYYLSGDKNGGKGHNDKGWDPLWSRWPQFSEMYVYNFIYGVGYWSNLMYPSVEAGVNFVTPGHRLRANTGPMFAARQDGLGGGDGSMYGWFGMVRYDFPLWQKIFGKRGDFSGHLTAELLDPGDYYTSDKVAYFLRWEFIFRF